MATIVTRETTQTDGTSPKGSPLTNAEVDTNFINLNDDKVEVSGAIIFQAKAGEALAKGDVVYVSGVSGNEPVVSKADADDASKMPAYGLAEDAASLNAAVNVVTFGTLYDLDTSSFSAGDTVYVSTTAGELTATKPTGESSLIQNVGRVIRPHASAGSIKVGGAGRANDTPNLNDGNVFIGNGSNQAVARALTGDDISGGTITSFASTGIDDNATATRLTVSNGFTEFDATNHYVKFNGSTDSTHIGTSSSNSGYSYFVNNSPTAGTGNNGFALYDSGAVEIWASADDVITGSLRINASGETTFTGDVVISEATPSITLDDADNADGELQIVQSSGNSFYRTRGVTGNGAHVFQRNNGTDVLKIFQTNTSGDVIFYENDGVTSGLTWDSSASKLTNFTSTGIDDNATSTAITIDSSGDVDLSGSFKYGNAGISASDADTASQPGFYQTSDLSTATNYPAFIGSSGPASLVTIAGQNVNNHTQLAFGLNGNNAFLRAYRAGNYKDWLQIITDDGSGNVGIGVSDPDVALEVTGDIRTSNGTSAYLRDGTPSASNPSYTFNGDTDTGMFRAANNQIGFSTAGSERMRIDSSGNVGIGESNPDNPLHINTTATTVAQKISTNISSSEGNGDFLQAYTINGVCSALNLVREGTTNTGLAFKTTGSGTLTERMRINSSGNVGIGTTSTSGVQGLLHIHSSSDDNGDGDGQVNFGDESTVIISTNATSAGGQGYYGSLFFGGQDLSSETQKVWKLAGLSAYSSTDLGTTGSADLLFYTTSSASTPSERMRIDSSGDLLVGNTLGPLGLISTTTTEGFGIDASETYVAISRSNNGSALYLNKPGESTATAGDFIQCRQNGTNVGEIDYDGADLVITQASDERLKNNIADSASAGSIIDAMQVRSFDWNNGVHVDYGFVAQELHQAYEPAAKVGGDDVDEEPWGIKTQKLIPLLVKEIQDLRARVAQLEGAS